MITHEQFNERMSPNRKFKTTVLDKVPEHLCLLSTAAIEIAETENEDRNKVRIIYQIFGDMYRDEDDDTVCVPRHIEIYNRDCALAIIYMHNGRLSNTIVSVNYPNECDRHTRNILEKGEIS
jgi:hypothetical protein